MERLLITARKTCTEWKAYTFYESMVGFENFSKNVTFIICKLSTGRTHEITENREHIKCLLRVTSLLGRQGLAFRGHDEYASRHYWYSEEKMERRYGRYMSPAYRNDEMTRFWWRIPHAEVGCTIFSRLYNKENRRVRVRACRLYSTYAMMEQVWSAGGLLESSYV